MRTMIAQRNRTARLAAGMLLLWATGPDAQGWGPVAHRAIGAIADKNLSPVARWEVGRWLRGATLAEVANWADEVRGTREYAHTAGYHFEAVPDGGNYLSSLRAKSPQELRKGGLVAGLMVAHLVLRDPQTPAGERADALKFLVHMAGDVHQPMHTGRTTDRGGTDIPMVWFGRRSNLHQVWDSGLIREGHRELLRPEMPVGKAGDAYAQCLLKKFAREPPPLGMNVEEWLEESLALRGTAYDTVMRTDPAGYVAMTVESLDRRVYAAGMRLARMVNDIAERRGVPEGEGELWRGMKEIMGDPREVIRLRPARTGKPFATKNSD